MLLVYENDGFANFSDEIIISENATNTNEVYVADMDGDGDKDVLSISGSKDNIVWHENNCNKYACTDPLACNYEENALYDDGSCLFDDCLGDCGGSAFEDTPCDDGDAMTENDVFDEECNCSGDAVSSIDEIEKKYFLRLYPIPAKDYLFIESDLNSNVRFYILDLTGKIISETVLEKESIDVHSLLSGIYFIKAESDDTILVKKFIKE